jgi:hypothetical protein
MSKSMNNIATNTTIKSPHGKIPLWIFVIFFSTLFIAVCSVGIAQYQQRQAQKSSQIQRTNVKKLQQSLLTQNDLINTNWLHTLNPLVKDVKGSVLWSSKEQRGIIKLYNLPSLSEKQQYHLWMYDLNAKNNAPISALVFKAKFKNLIIPFKAESIVNSPFKFEIMLEEKGIEGGLSLLLAQP